MTTTGKSGYDSRNRLSRAIPLRSGSIDGSVFNAPFGAFAKKFNFNVVADATALGIEDPAAHFEAAGVGLSSGADFGAPGFVRLNFGCTRDTLGQAVARMSQAVAAGGFGRP